MSAILAVFAKWRAMAAFAAFVGVVAIAVLPASVNAAETRNVRVGNSYLFELQGNPSTGYRWQLNQGASENLKIVKIDDLGYASAPGTSSQPKIGAPATYRFRITALAPGFAKLVFDYVRPWEGKPARTEEHWVHVD